MSLTRTLRSGVKEVRTYEKRQPRKRMKLVLEESATDKADSATSQTDSNVLIESKNTEQNQSNTSLEIFGPADDENLVDEEYEINDEDEKDGKNDEDADDDEEYDSDDDNNDIEDSDDDEKEEEEKEVEEVEEEGGAPKRKRSTFIPIKKYKTEAEADLFIRSSNPTSTFKIIYNHLVNCTLLCNNTEKHKMRYKQYKCSCIKSCSLSYVVRACDHCSICKYFVWVTGEHTNSENVSNGKTLQYGVPLFIQKIFEEYLEMDSTLSAKSLLIKLTKARKLNQKKEEEEKDKKLNFSKHLLPKINQVYIYTLFSPVLIN
jgi:hypothetical protein